jgi:hypothetical protein
LALPEVNIVDYLVGLFDAVFVHEGVRSSVSKTDYFDVRQGNPER